MGPLIMNLDQGLRILGLTRGTDAKTGRRIWRGLVRHWHPDRFAHNPELRVLAEERLKEINRAWEVVAPKLPGRPKNRNAVTPPQTDRSGENPDLSRPNAPTPWPRPGILRVLRRIRLRRILREIFSDPHRASAPGRGGHGSEPPPRIPQKGIREKSFDEVFNEVSHERPPVRSRLDRAASRNGPGRHSRPWGASRGSSGTVEGVEAADRVGAVRRPGRLRGIGRKR